jgi:gas vesicle protein
MTIRFVLGLTIGFLLGASFALALAPQGGAATRQQLWDKAAERVGGSGAE